MIPEARLHSHVLIPIAGLVLAASTALAQPPLPVAGDEAAIRQVVQQYAEARGAEDPAAITALFTEDADQLTSSGEWRRGREALVRGALASSRRAPGTRTLRVDTVRFPAPGVALADAGYEISGASGGEPRRMRSTFLLIRTEAGWRITAIRNMLPATGTP